MRGDRKGQHELYQALKSKMYALCLRYAQSKSDAEDILHDGFINVFRDIHQFKNEGPIEGWVRKVILNTALQHLRKQSKNVFLELNEKTPVDNYYNDEEIDHYSQEIMIKQMIDAMQHMPVGFKTVLNLYIMEGYTHDQIAATLNISSGTSKSQLKRAKDHLRKVLAHSLNVNE